MITKINFAPGDIVRVFEKIKDGVNTRTQIFQGTVLGIRGREENKSVRIRKLVGDVWIERIYPIKSPNIEKLLVKEHPRKKVRRAKLYYLYNNAK